MSRHCVVIPTYNNAATIASIASRALAICKNVIVVDDGSTDSTKKKLKPLRHQLHLITYSRNRGKGFALMTAFVQAKEMGFDYAVTIDADGQHQPEEIPMLVAKLTESGHDNVMVVGCRNLLADGMPASNSFANQFSNFWFMLQAARRLPDTQTGYRLYPLRYLPNRMLITNRYESELELLVLAAWRGTELLTVPVSVNYPPDRVTHFRPFADFARISLLNTVLCFAAIFYGYPRMAWNKIRKKK